MVNKILGPLYGRMEISTNASDSTASSNGGGLIMYQKTVYTFSSLKEILENNGFDKVQRYEWQKTIHKDYDDHSQAYYPHMDKENGILISLNVEATKL